MLKEHSSICICGLDIINDLIYSQRDIQLEYTYFGRDNWGYINLTKYSKEKKTWSIYSDGLDKKIWLTTLTGKVPISILTVVFGFLWLRLHATVHAKHFFSTMRKPFKARFVKRLNIKLYNWDIYISAPTKILLVLAMNIIQFFR